MKNMIKTFMVCLIMVVACAMISAPAAAQVGNVWQFPAFFSQPQVVPTISPLTGDILLDNFEYWDSPYNHGWVQNEPAYPVYGFGLGYATIFNTVLDLQEGSRVLDVYRPSSVFLLGTAYERHYISHSAPIDLTKNPVLSFKFRAPLGIEPWDIFQFDVQGLMDANYPVAITIRPVQSSNVACSPSGYSAYIPSNGWVSIGGTPFLQVMVDIGRGFLDGSWHVIWLDLPQVVQDAITAYTGTVPSGADGSGTDMDVMIASSVITVSGQMFRLDDINFRAGDFLNIAEPYLFKIGPRYAQIFEPYRYIFTATYETDECNDSGVISTVEDLLLSDQFANVFITDPNDIKAAWAADSNIPITDPNFADLVSAWAAAENDNPYFTAVDFALPVFANPNLRMGKNPLPAAQTLQWNATVNGIGQNGIQTSGMFGSGSVVSPLEIYPYDGVPTYLPVYARRCGCERNLAYYGGKSYFGPYPVYYLECALFNAGFTAWPNVAKLDFTPQVFEDIILTLEVTNGRHSDYETFPISVVNYPVENYPPYIEDVDDQIFYVGQYNQYMIGAIDPDCFIFSMAGQFAATTHKLPVASGSFLLGDFRTDMDSLTWQFTLNGLPSYQYGPWMDSMIDTTTGLVRFTPKFEGAYDGVLVATDNRGASSVAEFTIFCINKGTWLNHPPIIMGDWDHAQVVKAGEELILSAPEWCVEDPDGDELYYSCNIGACGKTADGDFMWTFQSNFPGFYTAEIVIYDIRGGYAIATLDLEVKPWWSY